MGTVYHSQYWARLLTLQGSGGEITSLSRSIANTCVDLNPHQVDAALFALRNPFSSGVILADEVGLGKTIEAGIVVSQKWAERKRNILIVVPATLRNQWSQELTEKFFINTKILDSKTFDSFQKNVGESPFDNTETAIICSYNFASSKAKEIAQVPWNLVVFDEAHRMRNVYHSIKRFASNPTCNKSMAHRILEAVGSAPKLLLTATPLQNSLLELYGLVGVVDGHVFGDLTSFRAQFVNARDENLRNALLRERLEHVCFRTLRKQIAEYASFTNRIPITQGFTPTQEEQELYDGISDYLQRDFLYALPSGQRRLITTVLRKLLASSTFALSNTLKKLVEKLNKLQKETDPFDDEDLDGIDSYKEEQLENDQEEQDGKILREEKEVENYSGSTSLKNERDELQRYFELASSILYNAKGDALLEALKTAFRKIDELGAAKKAVVFTESRQTQRYLVSLLEENGYAGQVVAIDGSNGDSRSQEIYKEWLDKGGAKYSSGSRNVDVKAALVERFRNNATILVATEAAAEGVNLQFCSLVVNYDLPWNPQRVEQRIGRCHRYGQKHDVVVVNFVNQDNEADVRVFQLLSEKFKLFEGVLGASDEILGALESGVDLERRILNVYQNCRTSQEIQVAFDELQQELDEKIKARLEKTQRALIENIDEEVRAKLRVRKNETQACLTQQETILLKLTRAELGDRAKFDPSGARFEWLEAAPNQPRFYNFNWKDAENRGDVFYRRDCPLAHILIERACNRKLQEATLCFNYSSHNGKISVVEELLGKSGWLELSVLTINSINRDQFLIFASTTDDGETLDEDVCRKMLTLDADVCNDFKPMPSEKLERARKELIDDYINKMDERNKEFLDEEAIKIDRWSQDQKCSLEEELKILDNEIAELKKSFIGKNVSLQEKLEKQHMIRELETKRKEKRKSLFDAQDNVDEKRDELIKKMESQLELNYECEKLFLVRWKVA